MTGEEIIGRLRTELLDWAEGRRSHTNEFMSLDPDPEHRVAVLTEVARADAAEVERLSAAIRALTLGGISRPTHTHEGDEFVYDGIGRREINRLRSLLAHSDRDGLSTWEVVEVAGDELARHLAGATS